MNEPCTVETGLLRKKPCGQLSIAKCASCERPLCMQHAIPVLSASQKKTGAFTCKECSDAQKHFEKNQAAVAKQEKDKKQAEMMKSMMNPQPPKKPGAAPAQPAAKPAAAKPAGEATDTIEYKPAPKPAPAAADIPDTIEYRPAGKPGDKK